MSGTTGKRSGVRCGWIPCRSLQSWQRCRISRPGGSPRPLRGWKSLTTACGDRWTPSSTGRSSASCCWTAPLRIPCCWWRAPLSCTLPCSASPMKKTRSFSLDPGRWAPAPRAPANGSGVIWGKPERPLCRSTTTA